MAIKLNGGNNPTAIKFVKNGTTTDLTEVWYKSSPNATAIKVWPDLISYRFAYAPGVFSYTPSEFILEEGKGQYLTNASQKNYPKSTSNTITEDKECVANYCDNKEGNFETIRTPYVLTTKTTVTTDSKPSSYTLTYKDGDSYVNLPDKSGKIYVNVSSYFTCPTVGFDKTTYTQPYYFVPTFTQSTKTDKYETTTDVYWAPTKVVNNRRLYMWTQYIYSVYPVSQDNIPLYVPGHGSTVNMQDKGMFAAIWYGPYSVSWSNKPNNLKIRADYYEQSVVNGHGKETWKPGTEHTEATGSFDLVVNAVLPASFTYDPTRVSYSFIGTDSTTWSVYKNGSFVKSFTGETTLTELYTTAGWEKK